MLPKTNDSLHHANFVFQRLQILIFEWPTHTHHHQHTPTHRLILLFLVTVGGCCVQYHGIIRGLHFGTDHVGAAAAKNRVLGAAVCESLSIVLAVGGGDLHRLL